MDDSEMGPAPAGPSPYEWDPMDPMMLRVLLQRRIDVIACVPVHTEDKSQLQRTWSSFRMSTYSPARTGLPEGEPLRTIVMFFVDGLNVAGNVDSVHCLFDMIGASPTLDEKQIIADAKAFVRAVKETKGPYLAHYFLPRPTDDGTGELIACVLAKRENRGKHDTQVQFFKALKMLMDESIKPPEDSRVTIIDPEQIPGRLLFVDSDTAFAPDAIAQLLYAYRCMENECGGERFDQYGQPLSQVFGISGQVVVDALSSPVLWAQYFEYKVGHALNKAAESTLDSVTCLPGAFVMLNTDVVLQLIEPESISPTDAEREQCFVQPMKYDKKLSAYDDVMIRNRRFLGEDRFLTTLALVRGFRSAYEPTAIARTKAMDSMIGLIKQRRRWDNSTLANALYLFKELFALRSKMRRSTRFVVAMNLLDTAFSVISPAFIYLLLFFFLTGVLPTVPSTVWHAVLAVILVVVGFAHFVPGWNLGASQLAYMSVIGNLCLLTAGASIYLMVRLVVTVSGALGPIIDVPILVMSLLTQGLTVGSVLLSLLVQDGWIALVRVISGLGSLLMLAFHNWFMKFYAVGNLHDLTWGTRGLDTGEDRTNVKISFLASLLVFTLNAGFLVMFFVLSSASVTPGTNTFTLVIGLIMCINTGFSSLVRLGFALFRKPHQVAACVDLVLAMRVVQARRTMLWAVLVTEILCILAYFVPVLIYCQSVSNAFCARFFELSFGQNVWAGLSSGFVILSALRAGLMIFFFFLYLSINRALYAFVWVTSFFLIAAHGVYELRPGLYVWETAPWAVCMVAQVLALAFQTLAFERLHRRCQEAGRPDGGRAVPLLEYVEPFVVEMSDVPAGASLAPAPPAPTLVISDAGGAAATAAAGVGAAAAPSLALPPRPPRPGRPFRSAESGGAASDGADGGGSPQPHSAAAAGAAGEGSSRAVTPEDAATPATPGDDGVAVTPVSPGLPSTPTTPGQPMLRAARRGAAADDTDSALDESSVSGVHGYAYAPDGTVYYTGGGELQPMPAGLTLALRKSSRATSSSGLGSSVLPGGLDLMGLPPTKADLAPTRPKVSSGRTCRRLGSFVFAAGVLAGTIATAVVASAGQTGTASFLLGIADIIVIDAVRALLQIVHAVYSHDAVFFALCGMAVFEIIYSGFRSPFINGRTTAATNGALVGMVAFTTIGVAVAFAFALAVRPADPRQRGCERCQSVADTDEEMVVAVPAPVFP